MKQFEREIEIREVSAEDFFTAFNHNWSRLNYKELVTVHDKEYYNNCDCYLANFGLAGFAINRETKEVVSLYSLLSQVYNKGGFMKAAAKIINNHKHAKRLDCFDYKFQPLPAIYQKYFNAKITKIEKFDKQYDTDGIFEKYDYPSVVYMELN